MAEFAWVHCNVCLFDLAAAQQSRRDPFSITSCGHLVCQACLDSSKREPHNACIVCSKACSVMQLRGQLPADVESLFADPVSLFHSALEVAQFQRKQLESLIGHMRGLMGKQRETLQKARDELLQMKELQTYADGLKANVAALEQQVRELRAENDRLSGKAPSDAPSFASGVPAALSKLHSASRQVPSALAAVMRPSSEHSKSIANSTNEAATWQHARPFPASRDGTAVTLGRLSLQSPSRTVNAPLHSPLHRAGHPSSMARHSPHTPQDSRVDREQPPRASDTGLVPVLRKRSRFPGSDRDDAGSNRWRP